MARTNARIELLQGTLDLLILRTLVFGPSHGHAIAKQIRVSRKTCSRSKPVLPGAPWTGGAGVDLIRVGDVGQKKAGKYYTLTRSGRKQLVSEQSKWEQLSNAMARVLRPAE